MVNRAMKLTRGFLPAALLSVMLTACSEGYKKMQLGDVISRSCGTVEAIDGSFEIKELTCQIDDSGGGVAVRADSGSELNPGGLVLQYSGSELGVQSTSGLKYDEYPNVLLNGSCSGNSAYTTPACVLELVELKRSEVTWTERWHIDEASSVTMRVSCPETMVYDGGDYQTETTQTPTRMEFTVTGCGISQ